MVFYDVKGQLLQAAWPCYDVKKKRDMKKILRKNSSLITKLHKGLAVKALECDELHFQLITSEVNGLLRDEYGKQLITT